MIYNRIKLVIKKSYKLLKMRKEYIQNKRLNEIFKFEMNELMKRKIYKVKSTIDFKCPEFFNNAKIFRIKRSIMNKKSN